MTKNNNFILLLNKSEQMIIYQIKLKMIFQKEIKMISVIRVLRVKDQRD